MHNGDGVILYAEFACGGRLSGYDIRRMSGSIWEYASRSLRVRHSFYSCLSVVMAGVTVGWLCFVYYGHSRWHGGGAVWEALFDCSSWPGVLALGAGVMGLIQSSRKRWLSFVGMAVTVGAYWVWSVSFNFA